MKQLLSDKIRELMIEHLGAWLGEKGEVEVIRVGNLETMVTVKLKDQTKRYFVVKIMEPV